MEIILRYLILRFVIDPWVDEVQGRLTYSNVLYIIGQIQSVLQELTHLKLFILKNVVCVSGIKIF